MPLFAILLVFACWSAAAQDLEQPPPLEPVPDGAPGSAEGDELEPQVRIIRREGAVIEEYSVGGRVYMVRIVPVKGLPYYLIDTDGDGQLETRRSDISPGLLVPGWVIFSW